MAWSTTVVYLSVLVLSVVFLYNQLAGRIPTRLRAEQAPRSEFGVVPVVAHDSCLRSDGIDIIFVHGLGSNPDTTWRARKKLPASATCTHPHASQKIGEDDYVCWVTDFLHNDLPPASRRRCRLFFYNHDSYWQRDAVQTRLRNLGQNLLHHINTGIRGTEEERGRELVFVGYSYGGLLIKQALVQASRNSALEEIAQRTKAVLFLGTPHRGSSFTRWGGIVAWMLRPLGSNPSILDEVAYDSLSLVDLDRDFAGVIDGDLRVVNFFEERETCVMKAGPFRWNEFCVREQSATFPGPAGRVQNIGLPVDHYGLNKFGWRSPEYKIVLAKLREVLVPVPRDLYSVPFNKVASYTARHELSHSIAEKLQESGQAEGRARALVIHGLGGSGKTQLALNFIEENRDRYSPTFWIDAQSPETVRSSFEECARKLGLRMGEASLLGEALGDIPAVKAVFTWLAERSELDTEWLTVVDNADDTSWNVEQVIPHGSRGSIIVTSRHPQSPRFLDKHCSRIQVGPMNSVEAHTLLLNHVQDRGEKESWEVTDLVEQVVGRLERFALAVDLAGASIAEGLDSLDGYSTTGDAMVAALRRYLVDYDRHRDELLRRQSFYHLSWYQKTVWTVWDTTFATIESKYPELHANLVLTFLTCLDRSNIQDELFRFASLGMLLMENELRSSNVTLPKWLQLVLTCQGEEWDDFHYRQAVDILVRYGLLQRVKAAREGIWRGVTMHSLVQWRAQQRERHEELELWSSIFLTAAAYQVNREESRPQFRRYLIPHLAAVGGEPVDDNRRPEQFNELMLFSWRVAGKVYFDEGRWTEAEDLQVRVMERSKTALGEEHPDTLTDMANLAATYRNQGRWTEAEELQVRVIERSKTALGEEHPDTLTDMANLAATYWNQGRWTEAEELQVRVIERSKTALGEEHPDTLSSMANLAVTYRNQGRWTEAEELQERVMERSKTALGEEHPDTLRSMANLAVTYRNQGRWAEAEELQVRVMERRKTALGEEHPDTLRSMANLAATYRNQGRWTEAEELQVRVIERRKTALGEEHPDTLSSMANLAVTYRNQGRWTEAEELLVYVIERSKTVLGEEHPDTLSSMANLAATYRNQGRWTEAEELLVYVIERSKTALGEEHPDTLSSMANLAVIYRKQGRDQAAMELMVECVQSRTRKLGLDHPDTEASMKTLDNWQRATTPMGDNDHNPDATTLSRTSVP